MIPWFTFSLSGQYFFGFPYETFRFPMTLTPISLP
jgi:cytochrome P450